MDIPALSENFKNKFALQKDPESGKLFPSKPSPEDVKQLVRVFLSMKSLSTDDNYEIVQTVTDCLTALRNTAAAGKESQNTIASVPELFEHSFLLFEYLLNHKRDSEAHSLCFTRVLQFLGNLVVENTDTQVLVWQSFSKVFLKNLHSEAFSPIPMIVYNVLLNNHNLVPKSIGFINSVLELYKTGNEYGTFLLELVFSEGIVPQFYNKLDQKDRVLILDQIIHFLRNEDYDNIHPGLLDFVCLNFTHKCDNILKTVSQYVESLDPLEAAKLMECVASYSGTERYLRRLQKDKCLLIQCCFLLKSIHSVSKESENDFSAIQKLSELQVLDENVVDHPSFGFKASLIRVIGNMCYKHKGNQDELRKLDCIPLLLDCCNIDGRNPLIMQWVILAIRNLCDGNDLNKSLISSLNLRGAVDSNMLREMGLTLHTDEENNKICVAPLVMNKDK